MPSPYFERCSGFYPRADDSDSALKQILLTMNEKQSFIIEDLDDNHVVIKADEEYRVRLEVEAEVRLQRTCDESVGV